MVESVASLKKILADTKDRSPHSIYSKVVGLVTDQSMLNKQAISDHETETFYAGSFWYDDGA